MVLVRPKHATRQGTCASEQFATKQLTERHESVVQGATDRRERREVPSSFDKHQIGGKQRTHSG